MSKLINKFPTIFRTETEVLQINVGKKCNQTCSHCHVSAGPDRTEDMSFETAQEIIKFAQKKKFKIADITGGAPEINEQFPYLLENLSSLCEEVIVRCNLTAALSRRQATEKLFRKFQPTIVASLPCYAVDNVDKQRGAGVFDKSIKALQWLNSLGYGKEKKLTLVYNPVKPMLPPDSAKLEIAYREKLRENFQIEFTNLIAIANVPIGRFRQELETNNMLHRYIDLLKQHHNPQNVPGLMCRNTINIDWQGFVFDCDFNNQIPLHPFSKPLHISEFNQGEWSHQAIAVADHCFTCTAGCGSSCGGALS